MSGFGFLVVVEVVICCMVLECADAPVAGAEGADGADDSGGAGSGGNHGYAVAHGSGADFTFVGIGAFAGGGVDNEIDFVIFDEVDDVGATAFADFREEFGSYFMFVEEIVSSAGRLDGETHGDEGSGEFEGVGLIFIADGEKDFAGGGEFTAGSHLRASKRHGEVDIHTHDFACGAHFGAEYDIDAGELGEGEHDILDGGVTRVVLLGDIEFVE